MKERSLFLSLGFVAHHAIVLILILQIVLFNRGNASKQEWRKNHFGKPIWVSALPNFTDNLKSTPSLLLVSSLGITAAIQSHTGDIIWRLLPPSSTKPVKPISLKYTKNNSLLLLLSTNQLIAINTQLGQVSWHIDACGFTLDERNDVVLISNCDVSKTPVRINLDDGIAMKQENQTVDQNSQNVDTLEALNASSGHMEWQFGEILVYSELDGKFWATEKTTGNTLWQREEGLAYPQAASMHVTKGGTRIIVLSQLGVIYVLNAENSGMILWKKAILNAESDNCILVGGHLRTITTACRDREERKTVVSIFDIENGEVISATSIENYICEQATIIPSEVRDSATVRMLSEEGEEKCISSSSNLVTNCEPIQGWLRYSRGSSDVSAWVQGKELWKVETPIGSSVLSVAGPRVYHPDELPLRPAPVHVTGDREILFQDVRPDIIMVLALDVDNSRLYAMLIDGRSGAVYDTVTHPEVAEPISITRGDSWFVYSCWNKALLQQEVHILDLYNENYDKHWLRKAFTRAATDMFGATVTNLVLSSLGIRDMDYTCSSASDDKICRAPGTEKNEAALSDQYDSGSSRPLKIRSNAILTERVIALDVTKTKRGITEPSVIMTLDSGQVTMVSKILLNARRPEGNFEESNSEVLFPYTPVISLKSTSRESTFLGDGLQISKIRKTLIAPHARESMSFIAVIGTDILHTIAKPVKSFDTLPHDFAYAGVVSLIIVLIWLYLITNRLKKKAVLTRAWE